MLVLVFHDASAAALDHKVTGVHNILCHNDAEELIAWIGNEPYLLHRICLQDASVDFDGHLVLTLTNGEEVDAGAVKELNEAQAPNVYMLTANCLLLTADR